MLEMHWLVRAARWARHPPSAGRVKLVLAVIAVVLAIGAVERFVGWPAWMTLEPEGRRTIMR